MDGTVAADFTLAELGEALRTVLFTGATAGLPGEADDDDDAANAAPACPRDLPTSLTLLSSAVARSLSNDAVFATADACDSVIATEMPDLKTFINSIQNRNNYKLGRLANSVALGSMLKNYCDS